MLQIEDGSGNDLLPSAEGYEDTLARLLELLPGARVIDGLGSSEGGGQGIQVTTAGGPVSTGTFLPSEGSVVVSEDRSRLLSPGDDEIGWMAKRGDTPLGCLGAAEPTARTFPLVDGERMSVPGDRARWRTDGSIELLGRDSVTINSGGEKIFAEEASNHIARYKLPKASVFADTVERSPAGKADYRWATAQAVAAP